MMTQAEKTYLTFVKLKNMANDMGFEKIAAKAEKIMLELAHKIIEDAGGRSN